MRYVGRSSLKYFTWFLFFFSSTINAKSTKHLLLVSIDGLKPKWVLNKASLKQVKLPFLASFVKEGLYAEGMKGVFPSLTYPSHTTMITGKFPKEHGVWANITFAPKLKSPNQWYWFYEHIKTSSLWSLAKDAGLTTANISWPVSVGAPITYNIPEYWRYDDPKRDHLLLKNLATKGLLEEVETQALSGKHFNHTWRIEDDKQRFTITKYLLKNKKPQLTTLYLGAYDGLAHKKGDDHPKALRVLEQYDAELKKLYQLGNKSFGVDNFVMMVVSDHGFSAVQKTLNINAHLYQKGLIELDGDKIKSYDAYCWESHGSCGLYVKNDSALRKKVDDLLNDLKKNKKIREIHEPQKLVRGHFDGAYKVVEVYEDTMIDERPVDGPLETQKPKYKATHGYHPNRKSMHGVLFAKGSSIKKENKGVVEMPEVTQLAKKILGL